MFAFLIGLSIILGEAFYWTQSLSEESSLSFSPQTASFKARSVRVHTKRKEIQGKYKHLIDWLYPIVDTKGIRMMLRITPMSQRHIGWIEPGFQRLNYTVLDNSSLDFLDDLTCSRYNIGFGYRYLLNSSWMLGGYGYYSYKGNSGTHHTINIGVENSFRNWRFIGNAFFNFKKPLVAQSNPSIWEWNAKIEKEFSSFKASLGYYHKKIQIKHFNEGVLRAQDNSQYTLPLYGGIFELKYTHRFHDYSVQFGCDSFGSPSIAFNMQWQCFKHFQDHISARLWQPTERDLVSFTLNSNVRAYLSDIAERLDEEYTTQWKTKQKELQRFCEVFTDQHRKQNLAWDPVVGLTQKEKNALQKWTANIPNLPFSEVPYRIFSKTPVFLLKEVTSQEIVDQDNKIMGLAQLIKARSITQNLLWLGLLHQDNEDNNSMISFSNDEYLFSPSKDRLKLVKKFSESTGNYFTQNESLKLIEMQQGPWRLSQLQEGDISIASDGRIYKRPALGKRLVFLQQMSRDPLLVPNGDMQSQAKVECDIEQLKTINQKLQADIISNLKWQRTGLFLADLAFEEKRPLLYFSNLLLKDSGSGLMVQRLRCLPFELQRKILFYVLINSLENNATIKENEIDRSFTLENDIRKRPSEANREYQNRLLRYYTDRLLYYLSSIKTEEEYKKYLAIPDNQYRALTWDW